MPQPAPAAVVRVQTGVRLEARLLNVLKGLAALKGLTLGDLLEGIVLHAFEGKSAFSDQTREQIDGLKRVYGLDLQASDSHGLVEAKQTSARAASRVAAKSRARKPGKSR